MLDIKISGERLTVSRGSEQLVLNWPAVAVSIGGRRHEARHPLGAVRRKGRGLIQNFQEGELHFQVWISRCREWLRKEVLIFCAGELPTPDYVEVDAQSLPGAGLSVRGYRATTAQSKREGAEEEGGGLMPGCGYPLIGASHFVGLEHPAARNLLEEGAESKCSYRLRHFPVWRDGQLASVAAVFGWGEAGEALFADYLQSIRLPPLARPLFSFCSFWSDPYLGNYEYDVREENYRSLMQEFGRLGLRPDVFTLDAGWQNRHTFFDAKESFGGNAGLRRLSREFNQAGIELSLWASHNGPMGIAPEYLAAQGIAVGGGESSAYCGDNYGVLLDERLEAELTRAFCRLAGPEFGAVHFKMDWDNDCAVAAPLRERYPTRDHVRQASIDAMGRIAERMRAVNARVVIRNGWWPSPWWLSRANHIFLSDSGDSEFAMLPSLSQRDSAATHRDLMYYNHLRRDRSAVPLDCFDNHEFPQAMRNPFMQDEGSWANTAWLAIMRGSSYLPYKLQPAALESWQVRTLQETMDFARAYAERLIVPRGRMVLGHPGKGDIYGFCLPGQRSTWLALRNPLPFPQVLRLDGEALCGHAVASLTQFYPDFRALPDGGEVTLLPGEVKLVQGNRRCRRLPFSLPFQVESWADGSCACRFPASSRPRVPEVYQIPALTAAVPAIRASATGLQLEWRLRAPYRMRQFRLYVRIRHPRQESYALSLSSSRYPGWRFSCYGIPVSELPWNQPGYGERKNPDGHPVRAARYFMAEIPQGGEVYLNLEVSGGRCPAEAVEIWAAGYEAAAEESAPLRRRPLDFDSILPSGHPFGFPLALCILPGGAGV